MSTMTSTAKAPSFVSFLNPIARRVLKVGPLLGPNALITTRGRKSGEPRTTPIALLQMDGRRWVIGTFGETNWVRNLRASHEATLTVGQKHMEVVADELDLQRRIDFFRDTVGPYVRRIRIGGVMLAVLGAKDVLEDPARAAEHRPVFELRAA